MLLQEQRTKPGDIPAKNLSLARRLHSLVRDHPDFEVLLEPTKYFYCFRYVPNALAERQEEHEIQRKLDDLNQEIVAAIKHRCRGLVMTASIRGRIAIRITIRSLETTEADVDAAFESIAQWGRLLSRNHKNDSDVETMKCSNEFCSSPTEA